VFYICFIFFTYLSNNSDLVFFNHLMSKFVLLQFEHTIVIYLHTINHDKRMNLVILCLFSVLACMVSYEVCIAESGLEMKDN
jgi:hypothetical protein